MSAEPQKTVEETPAAAPATETTPAPATETPAQPEAPKEETPQENTEAAAAPAADNADKPAEEPKDENDKDEVTPATEGQLGYKAPGLVKGLRFSKRFFYFQDDAVEAKQLTVFHQHEKPAVANPIAAWASQTGKGLLFLTKRAEDKATPAGIFSLADATDLTKEGSTEFLFKVNGTKHTFQAANAGERDSWVAALEAKIADAKSEKEAITGSEGYKAELEKLTKPAGAEAAKKPAENKEEAKKEEAQPEEAAPAEETSENKENKDKSAKSRSQSRKRASLFGSLLGKKEETEEKKDEKPEEAKAEANTEAPAESAQATETLAEAAPAAETAENKEENKAEQKEEPKEEKKDDKEEKKDKKAEKSKRASLFGNFFQKVSSPSQEKTEKEAAAPAETSVASTAPQLDNPVEGAAGKPIEPESVTAPADGEAAKDASAAQSPVETPKDKRRTSFFGNFGKKKGESSDTEDAEGKKGNKLGGLFRKPSKAVKLDNQKEETPADSETKAEEKPEPVAKDAPAEEKPAQEEAKPAEAPAEESKTNNVTSSTPVQAAA